MRRRAARGPGPWSDRRVARVRRSPYDGEILRLALPALGALAAEPLYLLADTAIVGHLGTPQLAALALAATVLGDARRAVHLPDLRHDGARLAPARRGAATRTPPRSARRRSGSRSALGVALAAVVAALAAPLVHALGGDGARRRPVGALPAHRRARRCRWRSSRWRGRAGCAAWATCARRSSSSWRPTPSTSCSSCCFVYGFGLGPRRLGRPARCWPSSGWASRSPPCCCARLPRPRPRAHPLAGVDRRAALRAHGGAAAAASCSPPRCAPASARRPSPRTRSPSSSSASSRSCSTRSPSPARSSSGARSAPATPTRPSPPRGA